MDGIEVNVKSASLDAALSRLLQRLNDPAPMLVKAGAAVRKNIDARFDSKTDPWGNAWKPWSPRTAAIRRQEKARGIYPNATLLVRSGRMRKSLAQTVDGNRLEVGFQVPYAVHHDDGTSLMPARPLLFGPGQDLGPSDAEALLTASMEYLERVLYKA